MKKLFIIFSISIFITLIFSAKITYAQTNIEFFFKNKKNYKDATVRKVINTDLISINENEKIDSTEIIRLIGLRSFELPKETTERQRQEEINKAFKFKEEKIKNPTIPIEEKALNYTKGLLEGKKVRLEFDTNKKDEDNRTLAYVFLKDNNLFVNAEILRQGFAYLQIKLPNKKYSKELRNAYIESRREKRGIQGE